MALPGKIRDQIRDLVGPLVRQWEEHRAWAWLERRGVSPRVVRAGGVSLGAHGLLFVLIALLPGLPLLLPEPQNSGREEEVLEIAFQSTAPEAEPPLETEAAPALPPTASPQEAASEPAPQTAPEAPRGIVTQLDPEYLKKTAEAPADASFIASHNAEATPGGAPAPTPGSEGEGLEFRTSTPAAAGEGSVAALGAWNKALANAIGTRWDHYRRTKVESLRPGSVRLRFSIDARGRVSDVHILSNDAGSTNALYAVRSTTEAKIPPVPADRLARLPGKGKRIEVKYTFTILPNS